MGQGASYVDSFGLSSEAAVSSLVAKLVYLGYRVYVGQNHQYFVSYRGATHYIKVTEKLCTSGPDTVIIYRALVHVD